MIDYHIHTYLCGHATGEIEEYVEKAIEYGLTEMGFSDHLPLLHIEDDTLAMNFSDLPYYVKTVLSLKDKYVSSISIKLGIEADYYPEQEEKTQKLLSQYPFDYVIGSVHFMDGWDFTHPDYIDGYKKDEISEIYKRYYSLLNRAVKSSLFDIVGHFDAVKTYNFKPPENIQKILMDSVISDIIKNIKKNNMCVELNTSGLRKIVKEIYPSEEILKICIDSGVNFVLGSDAHSPTLVGYDFMSAREKLLNMGCKDLIAFNLRQKKKYSL